MIDLDQATLNFLRAILEEGSKQFGHDKFNYKIDINIATLERDLGNSKVLSNEIQRASTKASSIIMQERKLELENSKWQGTFEK